MASISSPKAFEPGLDPASSWKTYKEEFEYFSVAAKLSKETVPTQVATFLHILGAVGRRIYHTLDIPETGDARTVPIMLLAFDHYYAPYKTDVFHQYAFITARQTPSQTFDDFYTDLKTKAQACNLEKEQNPLLRTMIVAGIHNEDLRIQLLNKGNALDLETAILMCKAHEITTTQARAMSMTTTQAAAVPAFTVDALNQHRSSTQRFQNLSTSAQQHMRHSSRPHAANYQRQPPTSFNSHRTQHHFQTSSQRSTQLCRNCGSQHRHQSCPAKNSKCLKCQRRGHWAATCRSSYSLQTQPLELEEIYDQVASPDDNDRYYEDFQHDDHSYSTYSISIHPLNRRSTALLTTDLNCHSTASMQKPTALGDELFDELYLYNARHRFKVDTGSQVNLIPRRIYDSLPYRPPLRQPLYTVSSYTGHSIPIDGIVNLPSTSGSAYLPMCPFYVTSRNHEPILGAVSSQQLGLIQHTLTPLGPPPQMPIKTMSTHETVKNASPHTVMTAPTDSIFTTATELIKHYQMVFDNVGKLPAAYDIKLKPNAVPIASACHKIPHAYRQATYDALDRMLQLDIITPVTEPTDWIHPIVVVPKPTKAPTSLSGAQTSSTPEVRICLDPRNLNGAIKREPYPLPTTQEIFAELHGCTVFTVLDAQSAFWQIPLTKNSSRLCTFATPHGRYRFKRLPYGIVTATEVFQRQMRHIFPLHQFPNVHISTDDFLIATPDMKSHLTVLHRILEQAKQYGLRFSTRKMQLAVPRITYLGHLITDKGVHVDPKKVEAICLLPPPQDKKALQRFLGMVNYICRFIPTYAENTAPLKLTEHLSTILANVNHIGS